MSFEIIALKSDGISTEIMEPALEVLRAVMAGEVEIHEEYSVGGISIDNCGDPLTDETLDACQRSDGVLLVAVGGPKWDHLDLSKSPEAALLGLRKRMGKDGLYANLRPVKPLPALYDASPIRRELIEGTDVLIVRESAGGAYFGRKTKTSDKGSDLWEYTTSEVERVARVAFGAAKTKVASADKANVLASGQQWREAVGALHQREFPHIELTNVLADNAAMQLIDESRKFEVILTENTFGDILSDVGAKITGSIGMLPSITLGAEDDPFLAEPVHGSAPDIAGQGSANPLATFLSIALMCRHGFKREAQASAIEAAVERAINSGLRTPDLGGNNSTKHAAKTVMRELVKLV